MAVSGVRSSCETLATKSRRIRSAWRRSVMSWSTSTAPGAPSVVTGAARATIVRFGSRGGENSVPSGVWPSSARPMQRADVRVAHHLGVVLARRESVRLHHAARGLVGEDDAALGVHHDHAFEHAGQDGLHAGAVLGEFRHPPAQFAGRVVEDARDGAQFVAARVARRAPRSRRRHTAVPPPRSR